MPWHYGRSRRHKIAGIAKRLLLLCMLFVLAWILARAVNGWTNAEPQQGGLLN